ncbi:MAG: immunoglobulin domain-containing protein [Verrucomicrobia bacterium]|nr:immunoglobulin domain-containing protein [Verrucomicrobiota bacterium]
MVVTNSLGAATSAPAAVLTVVLPPDSASPQVHQTVPTGGKATFMIEATGTPPLHYRWLVNGVGLAGAPDSSALIIGSATAELTGQIGVVVSNDYGAITNVVGTLSLVDLKMFAGVVISGLVGSHYRIEATPALADPPQWTTVVSDLAIPSSPYVWVDLSSPGHEKRFYRAVPLP